MADRRLRALIAIFRARTAGALLEVAASILRSQNGTGVLLGVVELPQGRPIAESVTIARRYRSLLQRVTELETRIEGSFGVQVRVASSLAQGVREAAYENAADLILLEWPGPRPLRPSDQTDRNIDDLVADPPTDLLLVRPDPSGQGLRISDGVLVPVRGGYSARLALRSAAALAGRRRVALTALHVHDPRHSEERRARESREFHELLRELGRRRVVPVEAVANSPSQAIAEAGGRHGVTVLGAFADAARSSILVGSRLTRTVAALPGTVILAKSARATPAILSDEVAPPLIVGGTEVGPVVDKWFAENTFHSREFRDIRRLVELKRRQGLTISLGLPTLNEEATIGAIIASLKGELMDCEPLVDEIVVIDSASTDRTVEIARSLGVPVVQHADVLREHGSFQGKGEALWKSLHVLRGDIVAWCDTDISNIHPQFVYGTVGPLLTDHRVSFVKGFYRRPLNFGGELQSAGGGRVTELTARPLFNLFYPLLSGLVQPLSGEYAGRRELLERLPFFTGYGVETGHLIDIVENFGLNSIAQIDLGVRIHRNQELLDLSKMAFAIMQVALKRLGDRHRIHLLEEVNRSMKLIHYNSDRFFLDVREIGDWERPPMTSIAEYVYSRSLGAQPNGPAAVDDFVRK